MRHPSSEPPEHVSDGYTHPANAGPPATLAGFEGDDVLVVS